MYGLGNEVCGLGREVIFVNKTAPPIENNYAITSGNPHLSNPESLGRLADQQNCVSFFWTAYLPTEKKGTADANHHSISGWTSVAQSFTTEKYAVKAAIIAHSLCILGKQHEDAGMMKEGLVAFGRALKGVRYGVEHFKNSRGADRELLLIGARLLSLFMVSLHFPIYLVHLSGLMYGVFWTRSSQSCRSS
jgi:hypothetical protein